MKDKVLHFKFIAFCLSLFLMSHVHAQLGEISSDPYHSSQSGQWTVLSSGTMNLLRALHFVDRHTGWTVGDNGMVLKTTDGGQSWIPLTSNTQIVLEGVCFISQQKGWVSGNSGLILHTENGGSYFSIQNSGVQNHLRDIFFADEQFGWAVGSGETILHGSDGGLNWQTQYVGSVNNLRSVHFVNRLKGWTVGDSGRIFYTTDGGQTWTTQTSGTSRILTKVHFVNEFTGWITGTNGTILKTTDGGLTWVSQSVATSSGFYTAHFIDDQTGWVAGSDGVIYHTTDGGNIWLSQNSGTFNWIWSLSFSDPNNGWAVGWAGTILRYSQNVLVDTPTLISPTHQSVDLPISPTLSWEAVTEADTYRVQLSSNPAFTTFIYDITGIESTSIQIDELAYGQTYYWRVNASNAEGTGLWSDVWQFSTTILSLPETVVLYSPQDGAQIEIYADQPQIDLYWYHSQPEITYYHLEVAFDDLFQDIFYSDEQITDTMYLLTGLQGNTTYFWRVRARNSDGWGAYSQPWSFSSLWVNVNEQYEDNGSVGIWPNPFNKQAEIAILLHQDSQVHIEIVDMLGRPVAKIFDGYACAGRHTYLWDASPVKKGWYYVVVKKKGLTTHNQINKTISVFYAGE